MDAYSSIYLLGWILEKLEFFGLFLGKIRYFRGEIGVLSLRDGKI